MKVRSVLLVAATAATAILPLATAHASTLPSFCDYPLRNVTAIGQGANTIYIDDRASTKAQGAVTVPGVASPGGTWLYVETNGQPGLQTNYKGVDLELETYASATGDQATADDTATTAGERDTCRYGWTLTTKKGDSFLF